MKSPSSVDTHSDDGDGMDWKLTLLLVLAAILVVFGLINLTGCQPNALC